MIGGHSARAGGERCGECTRSGLRQHRVGSHLLEGCHEVVVLGALHELGTQAKADQAVLLGLFLRRRRVVVILVVGVFVTRAVVGIVVFVRVARVVTG